MGNRRRLDAKRIVAVLRAHGADFIIVGGVAAVLQGAPIATWDLDVVHSRSAENIERLLAALRELDAIYRGQYGRRIEPAASHLASAGHQLLETSFGPLDLLGTVGEGLGYEDLAGHTIEMEAGEGLRVRVLALEKVIELKERAGREKDRATLAILRRTQEERGKG